MKKKIIAATLSAALAASFVLTGCGSTSDADATETIVESTEKVSVAEEESTEAESTETEAAEELVVKRKSISKASIKEEPIEETEETEREDGIASESAGYAYTDEEADGDTSDGSAGIAAGVGSVSNAADTSSTDTVADGFDKAAAQQVWASVNAERAAAGLNTLAWDEETYNFACQRAQAIVTNFSHDGCGNYGENIHWASYTESADSIHQSWYNSPGHHENYMRDIYTKGACAVYYCNGGTYAVENFVASWNDSSSSVSDDDAAAVVEEGVN